MRNDERLRTIYEVMAPYIVRSERNWRDYLAFASRFHKQSFDNILLVYAQDEDVTILASKKQWASVGRNLREAKPFRNDFGLDLFQYKGAVYEGRTGLHLCPLQEAEYLDLFIKSHGGIEQVQQIITRSLE